MKKVFLLLTVLTLTLVVLAFSTMNIYAVSCEDNSAQEKEEALENSNGEAAVRGTPGGGETNGETWYGIELDNDGKPIVTYNIEYEGSHLLDYLKPGDIVYERNNAFFIADWLKHIAIVIDVFPGDDETPAYVLMVEAMPSYNGHEYGIVYSLLTPTRFLEKQISIMRVNNATDTQIQGAISFVKNQVGEQWFLKPHKSTDDQIDIWYCSELVWAAYYNQGILLEPNDLTPVLPEEIYESDEVVTILDYRWNPVDGGDDYYKTTFDITDTHHTFHCGGDTYTEEHDYEVHNFCYEKCRACGYERQAKEHDYNYTTANSSVHEASCTDCGYTETKSHNFVCVGVKNSLHYEKCTDCGYIANQMSDYQCTSLNSTQHEKECNDCGYSETKSHTVTKASLDGTYHQSYCSDCGHIILTEAHTFTYTAHPGRRHSKTCSCGYSTTEACVGRASIGGTSYCVNCGQEMTFVFNPMSVDEEEYLPNTKEDEENQEQ